ncbi:RrF2 family transcriptional regulator [Effusibacillus dendaii]|uniref:AsnC family transcriptional regulator n=1 Tax=Effusibacillus dendaii TaxID=2743772 RepID=A0A7I8DCI4_9BACL|nr:Rrf2 family transcriptional regulator [Effusibacillus dendaii]BCJ87062.1 AsnC family transcriptional regulator [Effusibacillus dendaii]
MKLSARGHYGLIAMAYLAQRENEGPIPIKTIATAEQVPEQFLEQILFSMRKAGLVSSVRGPRGGYTLSRSSADITAGEVIRALEGPIAPVECLEADAEECCSKTDNCSTKFVWEKLRDTMVSVLDNITLQEIAQRGDKLIVNLEQTK